MKILAIESSTACCSVALGDGLAFVERSSDQPRRHNELLPGLIDEVLAAASLKPGQLDALAWGAGPGSFTGVRLAAAVTLGIALGAEVGCIAVDSMRALAGAVGREAGAAWSGEVGILMDARMQQCYFGCYRLDAGLVAVITPQLLASGEDPGLAAGALRGGDGWSLCGAPEAKRTMPLASDLWRVAAADLQAGARLSERPVPHYLIGESRWQRRPEADG